MATKNGQTYFVISNCAVRRPLFRKERRAILMDETVLPYEHPYGSPSGLFALDPVPQGLKPGSEVRQDGGIEVPPFQDKFGRRDEVLPFQS